MTNKTVTMSRELAESALTIVARNCTSNWSARVKDGIETALAAPVVERQDHVAEVEREFENDCGHVHLLQDLPDGTLLYASPPAPVAVVREPFAWYTEEYLTDKSATTYEIATAERWKAKGWPVQPLYISPELDAANAFAKGFNTLETGDGKYKIVMQFAGRDDAWAAYNALAKMTACLDKVKELNR